jgi:hypothetical protein
LSKSIVKGAIRKVSRHRKVKEADGALAGTHNHNLSIRLYTNGPGRIAQLKIIRCGDAATSEAGIERAVGVITSDRKIEVGAIVPENEANRFFSRNHDLAIGLQG